MKRYLKALILSIAVLNTIETIAQQQVMYTQYMFNALAINPAYAGSHEMLSASALYRQQWSGLDGAPVTQTFSLHSPVRNQKMGLGLLFIHDKIGVTTQTGTYVSYAYKIRFTNGATLSMGVQGGFTNYNAAFSKVSMTDPAFNKGDVTVWQPNAGGGLYYTTTRFYVGVSAPQLIQSVLDTDNPDSDSKLVRHYFLTTGYVFDLNPSLKLKPNVLIKYLAGAPIEIDLNANLLIQNIVWVGLSYRSFDSIDAILQLQLNPKLQLSYAYDFATQSSMNRINSGSHEIMLSYRIPIFRNAVVTPRYF
jgi:type IX secretion system PorP/SprF family membrane protein